MLSACRKSRETSFVVVAWRRQENGASLGDYDAVADVQHDFHLDSGAAVVLAAACAASRAKDVEFACGGAVFTTCAGAGFGFLPRVFFWSDGRSRESHDTHAAG